jgi:hypothetical protein
MFSNVCSSTVVLMGIGVGGDVWQQEPDELLEPWERPDLPDTDPVPPPPPFEAPFTLPAGLVPLPPPTGEERLDDAFDALDLATALESKSMALKARAIVDAQRSARLADCERGDEAVSSFLDMHVAGTLTVQQTTARALVEEAQHLVVRLPAALQALDEGWFRTYQAEVLVELTLRLTPEQCAQIEAKVLPGVRGRTTGALRRQVRRLVRKLQDQKQAERERRDAIADRGVHGSALEHGMGGAWATMPAGAQALFLSSLQQLATRAIAPGDTRTVQQRMSDILAALPSMVLDMAVGGYGPEVTAAVASQGFRVGGRATCVQSLLIAGTAVALGLSDEPAELVGYGPITAAHARALLADAVARLGTVDPCTGRLTAIDTRSFDLRPAGAATARSFRLTGEADHEVEDARDSGAPAGNGEAGGATTQRRTVDAPWQVLLREDLARLLGESKASPDGTRGDTVQHGAADDEPGPTDIDRAASPTGLPTPPPPEPQYRPSAALARLVRWRDARCVGPGCSVPSRMCDLEHRFP